MSIALEHLLQNPATLLFPVIGCGCHMGVAFFAAMCLDISMNRKQTKRASLRASSIMLFCRQQPKVVPPLEHSETFRLSIRASLHCRSILVPVFLKSGLPAEIT